MGANAADGSTCGVKGSTTSSSPSWSGCSISGSTAGRGDGGIRDNGEMGVGRVSVMTEARVSLISITFTPAVPKTAIALSTLPIGDALRSSCTSSISPSSHGSPATVCIEDNDTDADDAPVPFKSHGTVCVTEEDDDEPVSHISQATVCVEDDEHDNDPVPPKSQTLGSVKSDVTSSVPPISPFTCTRVRAAAASPISSVEFLDSKSDSTSPQFVDALHSVGVAAESESSHGAVMSGLGSIASSTFIVVVVTESIGGGGEGG
ncbi:hypothetical protein BC829DRAFT_382099 [Chytridium lagenaria]|nr:hypothetical protein BC829DRAFT_382099 [Chytridium lagenaria]